MLPYPLVLYQENRPQGCVADRGFFRTEPTPGYYRKVTQCRTHKHPALVTRFFDLLFHAGTEYGDTRSGRDRNFVIRSLIKDHVSDAWFKSASPLIAVVHSEDRISRAKKHHTATTKINVSRPSRFTLIAKCCADLLDDVCSDARFLRINLRHTTFEIHYHFNHAARWDRFGKVDSQRSALILEVDA